jgi:hypothetical protein
MKSIEKNYEILDVERNRSSIDFSIDNSKTYQTKVISHNQKRVKTTIEPGEKQAIDNFLNNRLKTESVPLIRLPETTRNVYKHKRTKENELLNSSSLFGDSKDFSTKDQTHIKVNNFNNLTNNSNNNQYIDFNNTTLINQSQLDNSNIVNVLPIRDESIKTNTYANI